MKCEENGLFDGLDVGPSTWVIGEIMQLMNEAIGVFNQRVFHEMGKQDIFMVHVVLLIRGNIRYFCGLIEDLLVTETYTCCLVLRRDVSPLYKLVMQPLITLGTF